MRKACLLLGFAVTLGLLASDSGQGGEKDKKKKDEKEGRKGSTIGVLVKKEKNFIEVKADGEEAPRKYFPQWIGGAPDKGGGLDKGMLKTFAGLKIGSRIEIQWVFEERLRARTVRGLAGDHAAGPLDLALQPGDVVVELVGRPAAEVLRLRRLLARLEVFEIHGRPPGVVCLSVWICSIRPATPFLQPDSVTP